MKYIVFIIATVSAASSLYAANCPDEPTDNSEQTLTIRLSASGNLLDAINAKLEKIPNVTASVSSASAQASGTKQNCCDGNVEVADGIKTASVGVDITGSVGGTIWGYHAESDTESGSDEGGGVFEYNWSFDVGLSVNAPISLTATTGWTYNECNGDDWFWGSASVATSPTLTAQVAGEVAVRVLGIEKTGEFTVMPAALTADLTGIAGYNEEDDACEGYGSATCNKITFTATLKIPGVTEFNFSKVVYDPAN